MLGCFIALLPGQVFSLISILSSRLSVSSNTYNIVKQGKVKGLVRMSGMLFRLSSTDLEGF